ncbi:MAG: hypothetical protein RIR26_430 [Pseudomonadota bacterium]
MPQSLDSLPPPVVEWRRESDGERKARLEKSGVLEPEKVPVETPEAQKRLMQLKAAHSTPLRLLLESQEQKESAKTSYLIWMGMEFGPWRSLRSPRNTSTVPDGSSGLSLEVTHADWVWKQTQLSFGVRGVFYQGGQYARLKNSIFEGDGFAQFSSSELGPSLAISRMSDQDSSSGRGIWSASFFYTPLRWISAERTSYFGMIDRSDTYSRKSMSLPGLGVQIGAGYEWNALIKTEIFSSVHGAWPLQVRQRYGATLAVALTSKELFPEGK